MIQDFYQKAIKFAGLKHANQNMPDSKANYLVHLSNVAMEVLTAYHKENSFDVELAVQAALLHDVLEDTDTSFAELKSKFDTQLATTVLALTKDKSLPDKKEQMRNSLIRINSTFKEATIVKLADRITNLQEPPQHWTNEKIKTYQNEASLILEKLKGKNSYLENRLKEKIINYNKYIK